MSGETKKRKYADKKKNKKEVETNGVITPVKTVDHKGAGFCVKLLFFISLAVFATVGLAVATGYKQGDLDELMSRVPPEVWQTRDKATVHIHKATTEIHKLYVSAVTYVGPTVENIKKKSKPYTDQLQPFF